MGSSSLVKLACAVLMCMVVAAPHAEAAITCSVVSSKVAPCIAYLTRDPSPSQACCAGIKALNSAAATPADRKTACSCLKSGAASIQGINSQKAAGLPRKCGVSIPYSISPNTDCSAIR